MFRKRRAWWLLLAFAGLLVGIASVMVLRGDALETRAARITEDLTADDVVRIMGRPADIQEYRLLTGDPGETPVVVMRWEEGRQAVQILVGDRGGVLEIRYWENPTLLERLRAWLGW